MGTARCRLDQFNCSADKKSEEACVSRTPSDQNPRIFRVRNGNWGRSRLTRAVRNIGINRSVPKSASMCGRVIQSSGPLRNAILEGMDDVRDSRGHNYPPRWNGAPSQDLLVIRPIIKLAPSRSTPCAGVSFPIGAKTRKAGASRSTPSARPTWQRLRRAIGPNPCARS
jgi:hypothetical protein